MAGSDTLAVDLWGGDVHADRPTMGAARVGPAVDCTNFVSEALHYGGQYPIKMNPYGDTSDLRYWYVKGQLNLPTDGH